MSNNAKLNGVVTAILLGIFITAIDQTIVSTAIPHIIRDLGGFNYFSWTFSAYLIAAMSTIPVMGKLADRYGRKILFIACLLLFMLGSTLCGFAGSMLQLVIFRAIQGIGGGALMPIGFPILYELFPIKKKSRMIALISMIYGISCIAGPLAGGFLTDYLDWHWIFFINLPIGFLTILIFHISYRAPQRSLKSSIDWRGIVFLVLFMLCLLFAIEIGGKVYAWGSFQTIGLMTGFIVFFILFLSNEAKAKDPVINLLLFKNRLLLACLNLSFVYGIMLLLCVTYIPLYVEGVLGGSASSSSAVLTPMMLAVVAGSVLGSFLINKFSFKNIMLLSATMVCIGFCLLSTIGLNHSNRLIMLFIVIAGSGIGISFSVIGTAAMFSVDRERRSSASALNELARGMGFMLGITAFSTLQVNELLTGIKRQLPSVYPLIKDGREIFRPEFRKNLSPDYLTRIQHVLANSITMVIAWAIPLTLAAMVVSLFMGNARLLPKKSSKFRSD